MPLYEFACADCDNRFEKLVRSSTAVNEVVCPTCGSSHVVKQVSTFAAKVSGGTPRFGSSSSDCSTGST